MLETFVRDAHFLCANEHPSQNTFASVSKYPDDEKERVLRKWHQEAKDEVEKAKEELEEARRQYQEATDWLSEVNDLLDKLPSSDPELNPSGDSVNLFQSNEDSTEERERLPHGYLEKKVVEVSHSKRRALHINEYLEYINQKIRKEFPGQDHLEAKRSSVQYPLKKLWKEGELERLVYDNYNHYYFHVIPEAVVEEDGEKRFASEEFKPKPEMLERVDNPKPQFLEPEE